MEKQEYEFRAISGRVTTIEFVAPYVVAACCNELRVYDVQGDAPRALARCAIFSPAHTVHGLRVLPCPTAANANRLFCVFGGCQLTVAQLAVADHPSVRHVTRVFTLAGWVFDVLAIRDSRSGPIPLLAVALSSNSVCLFDCDRGLPIRTYHHPETCTLFSAKLFSSRFTCESQAVEHRLVELNQLVCLSGTQFGSLFFWQPADSLGAQRCVLEGVRGGIYDIETDLRCSNSHNQPTHTHKLYVYVVSENRALNVFESAELHDDFRVDTTNLRHVDASFGHAARVWRVRKLPSLFTSSLSAADTKHYLATVGEDSRLLVWSLNDEARLTPHRSWQLPAGTGVWSLALAFQRQLCDAGSLWLLTGGADGSLWRVDLRSALAHQTHSIESVCLPLASTSSGSHSNNNDFIRSLCMLFSRAVVLCSDAGFIALVDLNETRQGDTQRIRVIDMDPRFRSYSTASQSDTQPLSNSSSSASRCLVAVGSACGFVRVLRVSMACGRLHLDSLLGSCVAAEKIMSLNWKLLGEEQLLFVSTLSGVVHCLNVADQMIARFRVEIPQLARYRFLSAVELMLDQSGHLHVVAGDRSSYIHYYALDDYRDYTDTNVQLPLCSFKAHFITSVRHIVRLNDCSRCSERRVMLLSAGCDGRLCEFALDCAKRTLVLEGEHRPLRERDAHADWLERIVQLEVHGRSSLLLVAFRADRCQLHLFDLRSARAVVVAEFDCGGAHREFSMNVASCGGNAVSFAFAYVHRRKLSVVRRVVVPELQLVSDACTHGGVQVWDAIELPLPSNDDGCHVVALACEDGVIRLVGLVTAPCADDAGVLSVDLCAIPGHSCAVKCLELVSIATENESRTEAADGGEVRFVLLSGGAKAELRVHVVRIDVCQLRRLLLPRVAVTAPACPSWRHVVSFSLKASCLLLQQPNAASLSNARRRHPSATESRIMCLVSFRAQRRDARTPTRCVSVQSDGAHDDDDGAIRVVAGTSDSRLCMFSLSHDRLRPCTCVKRQRHCVTCIKHVHCAGKDLLLSSSTNGSLAVWLADGDELLLRFDKLLFPSCVYSFDLLHPGPGTHTCCMLTVAAGCDDGLLHVTVLRATDASFNVFEPLDRTNTPHTAGHVCALTSVALCAHDLPRLLCAAGDMHVSDWHLHTPNVALTQGSDNAIGVPDVQRLRVLRGLCVILVGDGLGLMRPLNNSTQSSVLL